MMRIYLIRHGKTAGNILHKYVGRTDEPLCDAGRLELQRVSAPGVDGVFASPMGRCLETAMLLYPGREVRTEERLRECDFGRFEMKTWKELSGDQDYQAWIDSGGRLPFPGGESQEAFRRRCRQGFEEVLRMAGEKGLQRIALIVHGGTIMSVMDAWSAPHRDYFDWQIGNGQILAVTADLKKWRQGDKELRTEAPGRGK